jgi:hypothetical protein
VDDEIGCRRLPTDLHKATTLIIFAIVHSQVKKGKHNPKQLYRHHTTPPTATHKYKLQEK